LLRDIGDGLGGQPFPGLIPPRIIHSLRGVKQNIQIAKVAVTEAVAHPEVRFDDRSERDLDFFSSLTVVHILQAVNASQTNSRRAVAPGGHEPRCRLIFF